MSFCCHTFGEESTSAIDIVLELRSTHAYLICGSFCPTCIPIAVATLPRYFISTCSNARSLAHAFVFAENIGPIYPQERWRTSVKNTVRMSVFLMKFLTSLVKTIGFGLDFFVFYPFFYILANKMRYFSLFILFLLSSIHSLETFSADFHIISRSEW